MDSIPEWVTLTTGESIVWSGGPSSAHLAQELVGETVLVIIGLAVAVVGPALIDAGSLPVVDTIQGGLATVGLAIAVIGVLLGLATYLRFQAVQYLVTTDELYVKRGMVSRSVTNLPLDRVQDSGFEQSTLQRLLGYGDVYVSTAGSSGAELIFRNVPDPAEINGIVTERLHEVDTRQ